MTPIFGKGKNGPGNCRPRSLISGKVMEQLIQKYVFRHTSLILNIFNDLAAGPECTLNKFANDTKEGGVADTPVNCAALQRDFNRLEKWAYEWEPHEVH